MKKFKLIALILLLGSVASCGKESISNSTISSTSDKKTDISSTNKAETIDDKFDKLLSDMAYGYRFKTTATTLTSDGYSNYCLDIGVKDNGYDVEEAKKLLKEAGCKDTDNDGILEKDGKKLEALYRQGYETAKRQAEALKKYLEDESVSSQEKTNIDILNYVTETESFL